MTLISQVYCTETDLVRRYSQATVTFWADQTETNTETTGVIDDAINQAAQEIELYCRGQYTQAGLASCSMINRWAVLITAFYASTTRGNPPPASVENDYNRVLGLLEKVRLGVFRLPGIPLRADLRPTWSNLRIDRRYIQTKIRVQQQGSTPAPTTQSTNLDDEIPSNFL